MSQERTMCYTIPATDVPHSFSVMPDNPADSISLVLVCIQCGETRTIQGVS